MKWMTFYAKSGNQIITETSNIDRIIVDPDSRSGSLKLRNGDRYDIIDDGIWDRLLMIEGKAKLNSLYGMVASSPLPDYEPEIFRSEIKDLKLENDRLKRRNELMEDYIHAVACVESKKSKFYGLCDTISCPYYDYDKSFGEGACTLGSRELIEKEAADLIDKLEDL